ncbi:MAG: rod shape-determining protein MreC, partial [Selenomonadaceae bacterium]|nr:rod shape-determining protein MreC [Selenomonadaceae bacterium]
MKERIKREKKTGRKVLALLFVFVSVFCLVFFAARGRFETPVANTTTSLILSPFQSVVSWAVTRLNFITSTVDDIMNVHEQNRLLLAEIEQLRAQNLAASEFEAENQ